MMMATPRTAMGVAQTALLWRMDTRAQCQATALLPCVKPFVGTALGQATKDVTTQMQMQETDALTLVRWSAVTRAWAAPRQPLMSALRRAATQW